MHIKCSSASVVTTGRIIFEEFSIDFNVCKSKKLSMNFIYLCVLNVNKFRPRILIDFLVVFLFLVIFRSEPYFTKFNHIIFLLVLKNGRIPNLSSFVHAKKTNTFHSSPKIVWLIHLSARKLILLFKFSSKF